jgi:hypothetical protein
MADRNFIWFQAVTFSQSEVPSGVNNSRRHEDAAKSSSHGNEIKINVWKQIQQGQEAEGGSAIGLIRMQFNRKVSSLLFQCSLFLFFECLYCRPEINKSNPCRCGRKASACSRLPHHFRRKHATNLNMLGSSSAPMVTSGMQSMTTLKASML